MDDTAGSPRIAGFDLLGRLGEGAMGVVYEAEQHEPRRRVALKVIPGGRVDPELGWRLEMEARALARLRHPGIVPLLSQGKTEDGMAWFAMELVEGVSLGQFMSEESPGLQARVRLFRQVVAAVAHAHQNGVIHRDLKPSNILVSAASTHGGTRTSDRVGYVRVLDFGLARIAEDAQKPASNMTEQGRVIGTLSYMSPEQARGEVDLVDQRTDIYSLGVILYELLTDRLPIDVEGCWVGEAARRISEQEPVRPRSARRVPADLETIILKALQKSPERRYQSASSMEEDIERWSGGHPIQAHPPSAIYQLRRLVGRHKTATAVVSLLLLSLIAFIPSYVVVKSGQARAIEEERDAALAVLEFQKQMLTSPHPSVDGHQVRLADVLARSSRQITQDYRERPKTELLLRGVVGRAYAAIGLPEKAEPELRRAVELSRAVHGEEHARSREAKRQLSELLAAAEKSGP